MRTALTIGLILGSDVWEFVHGPEADIPTQRADFKKLRASDAHPKYAEIQLWESGSGIVLRHRFHRLAPADAARVTDVPTPASEAPAEDTKDDFDVPAAEGGKARRGGKRH